MQRRTFVSAVATGAALTGVAPIGCSQVLPEGSATAPINPAADFVMTVRGPVATSALGFTLPHEHILVDFIGAEQVSPSRYEAEAVFDFALAPLRQAHDLGARTVFECTPAFLGRDPALLRRLSGATSLHLITNTGFYGVRRNLFLPRYALDAPAAQLAAEWTSEYQNGIADTRIRPGFIKSGVDAEPALSDVHRKLIEAAALTHRATGLTIAVHTGRGPGLAQLDLLRESGVAPSAFVWVHAQGARDDDLFAAADRGAWISLDGLNRNSLPRHLHLCRELKVRGHLGRVLLSHDAGWFDPAKPGGGTFRPYDLLFTAFLPQLRTAGFEAVEIDKLTIANPAEAFAVRPRLL